MAAKRTGRRDAGRGATDLRACAKRRVSGGGRWVGGARGGKGGWSVASRGRGAGIAGKGERAWAEQRTALADIPQRGSWRHEDGRNRRGKDGGTRGCRRAKAAAAPLRPAGEVRRGGRNRRGWGGCERSSGGEEEASCARGREGARGGLLPCTSAVMPIRRASAGRDARQRCQSGRRWSSS